MDLIHVLPLLKLKLVLLLMYLFLWYSINKLFNYLNQNNEVRLDLMTAFFYYTIPPFMILILVYQAIIGYHGYWPTHIQVVIASVGFYLFGVIEEFRVREKPQWDIVIHHSVFGSFFFVFAIILKYEVVWCWLFSTQVSGVFYSLGKAMSKHNPVVYAKIKNFLEIANYWCFLGTRIIFQTGIMIYLAQKIWTEKPEEYIANSIITLSFFLSSALNINWFIYIRKRYTTTKAKMALSQQ